MTRTLRLAVAVLLTAILAFGAAPAPFVIEWGAPVDWILVPTPVLAPAFPPVERPISSPPAIDAAPRRGPPSQA